MKFTPEPIRARRNTPYIQVFPVDVTDLTGHYAAMQVRLYGMAAYGPLINLETVETELTHGITLSGADATVYIDQEILDALPLSNVTGKDDRFSYDLTITAPDGYSWVQSFGDFYVAQGVTDAA